MKNKIKACVQCGYCCKVCACFFGKWNENKHQCDSLKENQDGTFDCGLYDVISKHPDSEMSPAFGFGCTSPLFNNDRDKIIKRIGEKYVY